MALETVTSVEHLRSAVADARRANRTIGFVPTMGALHAGHVSLIEASRRNGDFTIVSIFVNPTQFGPGDDYDRYPRTLDADRAICDAAAAHVLFVPQHEDVYPKGDQTRVRPGPLADGLCGPFRPGHFEGVCTVVAKLFCMVQPDVAYLGQKDAQQVAIIRRMVEDLRLPITIVSGSTVREADGLALSSRNQYLSEEQRAVAPTLHSVLEGISMNLQDGIRDYAVLEQRALDALTDAGFDPEYVGIRRAENLEPPDRDHDEIVILGAARLGTARLIDNIVVHI